MSLIHLKHRPPCHFIASLQRKNGRIHNPLEKSFKRIIRILNHSLICHFHLQSISNSQVSETNNRSMCQKTFANELVLFTAKNLISFGGLSGITDR